MRDFACVTGMACSIHGLISKMVSSSATKDKAAAVTFVDGHKEQNLQSFARLLNDFPGRQAQMQRP